MKNKSFLKKLGAGALAAVMTVSSIPVNATELATEGITEAVSETSSESAVPVEAETEISVPEETESPVYTEVPVETSVPTESSAETEIPMETEIPSFTDSGDSSETILEPETEMVFESESETISSQIEVRTENADVYFVSDLEKLKKGTLTDPDLEKDTVPETEADTPEKAEQRAAAIQAAGNVLPDEYVSLLTDESYKLLMKQEHLFEASENVGFYVVPAEGYETDTVKAYDGYGELDVYDYENSAYEVIMPDQDILLDVKTAAYEQETESETEEGIGYLEAEDGNVKVIVLSSDYPLPADAQLEVYAGENLKELYEAEDAWNYDEFLSDLKLQWKEELLQKYQAEHPAMDESTAEEASMDMVKHIVPFDFKLFDAEGNEIELPEEADVFAYLYDTDIYETAQNEQYIYNVGLHEDGTVSVTDDPEVTVNSEEQYLAVKTKAEKTGLYSVIQVEGSIKEDSQTEVSCTCGSSAEEALQHDWNCPVFWEEFLQLCDCGAEEQKVTSHEVSCAAVWMAFDAACSGCDAHGVSGVLHDKCEVVSLIHKELCDCGEDYTNLEEAVDAHEENSAFVAYIMKLAEYVNSQIDTAATTTYVVNGSQTSTLASSASGWTNASTSALQSGYLPIKFYSGKSEAVLVGSSVANKWALNTHDNNTSTIKGYYWQPKAAGLDGSGHGMLYKNVVFDYTDQSWYDLKFTIDKYSGDILGGTQVYPFAGFDIRSVSLNFYRGGPMVVKAQIYKASTSTIVTKNVRLAMWDIDEKQFCAVKANNGSISKKYYYTGTTVRVKDNVTLAGVTGMTYTEDSSGTNYNSTADPEGCVVFDLKGCSSFSIGLGYWNNSDVSNSTVTSRYENLSNGEAHGDFGAQTIYAVLPVAPEVFPVTPKKFVSNTDLGATFWGTTSNTLKTPNDEYYYCIDYTIADTLDEYKFSSMVLTDTLPTGVTYRSSWKVYQSDTMVKGGTLAMTDVTSWFSSSGTTSNKIVITANKCSDINFYGHSYKFVFKVKMNKSSITPTSSNNVETYKVSNTASIKVVRNTVTSTANTNAATTTAVENYGNLTINKTLSGINTAFYDTIPDANKTFTFTLSGTATNGETVSRTIKVVGGSSTTVTKIPVGTYTLTESLDDKYWTCITTNPRSITISLNNTTSVTFNNKVSTGNLTVQKAIENIDPDMIKDDEDKKFTFQLYGTSAYNTSVNITKELTGSGAITFGNVPIGTYTLKETCDDSLWESSPVTQTVEITKDTGIVVKVTNTYLPEREDQPAPEKSFDGSRGVEQKRISTRSASITYSIFQQVKASDHEAVAPVKLTFTDVLDPAFEYQSFKAYSSTDAGTTWNEDTSFQDATEGNNVSIYKEQDSMDTAVWYRVDLTVKIRSDCHLDDYVQDVNGTNMYVIPNVASTTFTYKTGTPVDVTKETNKVIVVMPLDELSIKVKKSNEVTGENISNAEFTVYEWDGTGYNVEVGKMEYDEYQKLYVIKNLRKTDVNQGNFKIIETVTPWGHVGSWSKEVVVGENATETFDATNPMGMGTITILKKDNHDTVLKDAVFSITAVEDIVSPQGKVLVTAGTEVDKVTTGSDGKAVSKPLYPGKYTVVETEAPLGYILDDTSHDVEVLYQDKDTALTNVDITVVNEKLYRTITVTKEIDTDGIVWAHGNPTFTFKVTGTDIFGADHTYYDTVEFTADNIGNGDKTSLKTVFTVPAGIYTVSEEKTARYKLENIHDVVNGTIKGETVVIDVSDKKDGIDRSSGSAVFYNRKTTDEDLTHTAFVRNTIA